MVKRVFSERAEEKIAEAYEARDMGATAIGNAWGISAGTVVSIHRRLAKRKAEAAVSEPAPCALLSIHIPGLRLTNPLNTRVHWRVLSKRGKEQKEAVGYALLAAGLSDIKWPTPKHPWRVVITRMGPRAMDDDSVVSSAKHVRDAVAKFIYVDDRHRHIVRYEYSQERSREYGVRIEIFKMEVVR